MLLFLLSTVNTIFLDLSLNNQPALHYQPILSFLEGQPILSFLISKSDNTLFLDLMVSTIFPDKHQLTNPTTKPVLTPTNKLQTSNHKGLSPIKASKLDKQ
jgi:hypothetical protein